MKLKTERPLRKNLHTEAGATFVRLPRARYGSLDSEKLERLRRLLSGRAAKCAPRFLVVDFSEVEFFGAGLVGVLVSTRNRLQQRNRELVLCGLNPQCRKLLVRLHLDLLLEIYPTQFLALLDRAG